MAEFVSIEKNSQLALVGLDRPEAYNAFNLEMVSSLAHNLVTLAYDDSVRGVVLYGEGRAFCAGGDLKWVSQHPGGAPAGFHELAARFHLAILEIRRMPKPVIAAVHGAAAGGGFSLALACDFRIMAKSAYFRQAYTSNGLSIDGGGTYTLPRLVGLARALEIAALDRPISSEEALAWGLAFRVVDDGKEREEALGLAGELIKKSRHSFARSKQLLNDSFDTPFETQLERERQALSECAGHPDGIEGLRAFAEKRKPTYLGT